MLFIRKTVTKVLKMKRDAIKQLKSYCKEKQATAQVVYQLPKHKYCYILGTNKKETKDLRKQFLSKNKVYSYPKERGK